MATAQKKLTAAQRICILREFETLDPFSIPLDDSEKVARERALFWMLMPEVHAMRKSNMAFVKIAVRLRRLGLDLPIATLRENYYEMLPSLETHLEDDGKTPGRNIHQ
ncbi:hypothetical protein [Paraburkholderia mimosarum]|uniref:hypothetical protein n=1 Tax=Paraburkholderia mimosarum TaxID=312026 RepID=UPI000482B8FF|nr:hypothetical protein [Paraburkholderia mimosarum]